MKDLATVLSDIEPKLLIDPLRVQLGSTSEQHDAIMKYCCLTSVTAELDPDDNRSRFLVRVVNADGKKATYRWSSFPNRWTNED